MARRHVAIAGAGIAGLTAALSFAAKGFSVSIFERAEHLEEAGAGLQLSPNATRILASLGVLERLRRNAIQPEAIHLKDAASLAPLARIPLGEAAEARWGAPYLVSHRADLQLALLQAVEDCAAIALTTGAEIGKAEFGTAGVTALVQDRQGERKLACEFLIAADGVWSGLRRLAGRGESRFTGYIAHRAILRREGLEVDDILPPDSVTAFLSPRFHLVAYPLRGGTEINLVAITKGAEVGRRWASSADIDHMRAIARDAPALSALAVQAGAWTAWPIHEVEVPGRWGDPGGLVLIGDAAHALAPFAAQGAAMAIEDAAVLAELATRKANVPSMLAGFERLRRPRLARVARRGNFNRLVWHAGGPIALVRNLALRFFRNEQRLAADLDWLYGYDAAAEAGDA
ncbi:FAD-dependent monooxygenase [Chelativorans sp.]|uniref:FAD-dependent monooxygenase n=1 Tax=Chelativorans sp. TaxID=2203393 RepID=UPI0028109D69|nr:FAD-dependent monooxygenase [Chelativorans sp.]